MDTSRFPRPPIVVRDADPRILLTVYLQDHHAGSVGGLALARRCAGNNTEEPLHTFLRELVREIEEDQTSLETVMSHHSIAPSPVKSPMALVAERLGRGKLNGQLVGYSPVSRLEEIEGLIAGVSAKRELWRALAALPDGAIPAGVDLDALEARADEQLARLEEHHRTAARIAFSGLSASRPAGSR